MHSPGLCGEIIVALGRIAEGVQFFVTVIYLPPYLHLHRCEVGDPGGAIFQRGATVAAALGLGGEFEYAVRIIGNGLGGHGLGIGVAGGIDPYGLSGVVGRSARGSRFLGLVGFDRLRGLLRHGEGLAQKLLFPVKGAEMEQRLLLGCGEGQAGRIRLQLLHGEESWRVSRDVEDAVPGRLLPA